ncbi:MAG: RidA family protein [Chloroflexota bacterium]|nr:MAG: RidA family protein [Chloroflexota bacterium]
MSPEEKLAQLGIQLKTVPIGDRPLVPWVQSGNLLFLSGAGPSFSGTKWSGQVGSDYTTEQGYEAARECALQLLSSTRTALGTLNRVRRIVKVLGMVNSAPGFSEQPRVINGCSDLLVELFGPNGRHARSAVGMAALPNNIPVEIEIIIEVDA